MGPKTERLTILRAATHETELGDHDFCLSRSHYTDTDPTSREQVATAGIEPRTSSPGVARSTVPPLLQANNDKDLNHVYLAVHNLSKNCEVELQWLQAYCILSGKETVDFLTH